MIPDFPQAMVNSPIQFAMVREDPRIECRLIGDSGAAHVALIASGGCSDWRLS